MAQYMGTVQGCRKSCSRLGSKSSGLVTMANGWNVGIQVHLYFDEETGKDRFAVFLTGGSNGGVILSLAKGTLDEFEVYTQAVSQYNKDSKSIIYPKE